MNAAAKRKGSFKKWLRSSHRKFTSNAANVRHGNGNLKENSMLNTSSNGTPAIQDVILLNNSVIAQDGVYQFRGVELRADPGSSPSLNLGFAGLQTFGNPMKFA